MPSFKASDALSTITESTMQDGDEDVSDDSFEKFEANVWNTALRLTIPAITATAKIATKSPAPLGLAGGTVRKDKGKKNVSGAASTAVMTAASSSGH